MLALSGTVILWEALLNHAIAFICISAANVSEFVCNILNAQPARLQEDSHNTEN